MIEGVPELLAVVLADALGGAGHFDVDLGFAAEVGGEVAEG